MRNGRPRAYSQPACKPATGSLRQKARRRMHHNNMDRRPPGHRYALIIAKGRLQHLGITVAGPHKHSMQADGLHSCMQPCSPTGTNLGLHSRYVQLPNTPLGLLEVDVAEGTADSQARGRALALRGADHTPAVLELHRAARTLHALVLWAPGRWLVVLGQPQGCSVSRHDGTGVAHMRSPQRAACSRQTAVSTSRAPALECSEALGAHMLE